MQHTTLPRALRGSVSAALPRALANADRANGHVRAQGGDDPAALFNQIQATLGEMGTRFRARLDGAEETISNLTASMSAMQQQANSGFSNSNSTIVPVDREYTDAYASFLRTGDEEARLRAANSSGQRAAIHAAMSSGSDSNGGFLAPVEWDRRISQAQVATSPMRRLAQVQVTSVGAYSTLWNSGNPGSGWVGETAARPLTTTPTFAALTFAAGEIYAQPAVTQRLLDDAAIDVAEWLIDALRVEFNRQESIAFLSGDGVNKPSGLLTYVTGGANETTHPGGPLEVVEGELDVDDLIDFAYSLPAPYRANSSWLMSSLTAASLSKLKDSDGNLVWRESLIVGQPATLLGRPVEIDEGMPGPVAGSLTIAFGDFKAGYLINDRVSSVRILRDPYSNKPYVNFYATKRVGAGVLDPTAIRLLRVAA